MRNQQAAFIAESRQFIELRRIAFADKPAVPRQNRKIDRQRPLKLVNPSIGVADIGFEGGKLIVTVAIHLASGSLSFGGGQSSTGVKAELTGVLATFDLAVGLPGNFSLSGTGKFSVNVTSCWSRYRMY